MEVDFILGDMQVAVEVKAGRVHEGDLAGLKTLLSEHRIKRAVIVSMESQRRNLQDVAEVLPWRDFLTELWSGALGV